ncbi:MAG: hypothetical protein J2P27_11745 [Actinobacteria bacterium]|nr:hypothetical protein [Actinomycetota bacterium]
MPFSSYRDNWIPGRLDEMVHPGEQARLAASGQPAGSCTHTTFSSWTVQRECTLGAGAGEAGAGAAAERTGALGGGLDGSCATTGAAGTGLGRCVRTGSGVALPGVWDWVTCGPAAVCSGAEPSSATSPAAPIAPTADETKAACKGRLLISLQMANAPDAASPPLMNLRTRRRLG